MTHDHRVRMQSVRSPKPFVVTSLAILVCLVATLSTGCGRTATITRTSAGPIEGKITTSDRKTVYVRRATDGVHVSVPRADIADIDHPGNVAAVAGAAILAYGVASPLIFEPDCGRNGLSYCVSVYLPAFLGASTLIYGIGVWSRSVYNAAPSDASSARRITVVPVASMDKTNQFYGASARVSF